MLGLLMVLLAPQDDSPNSKEFREIEELRQDIEALRMINPLGLTKEQIEKILAWSDEWRRKMSERAVPGGVLEVFRATFARLDKGEELSPEEGQRLAEAQQKLGQGPEDTGKLKEIFSEKQLETLSRAGRPDPLAPLREQFRRHLPEIRQIPDEAFEQAFAENLGQQIKGIAQHFGGLSDKELEDEVGRVMKIFQEIRGLSEDELKDKGEEQLKKITDEGKLGELSKKGGGRDADRHLAALFGNPRILRILKNRLEPNK